MKKTVLTLQAALLAFCFEAAGQTEWITTAQGEGGDIYIKPGMTNRQNSLQVKNAEREGGDPHVTTKTYLKFDISGISDRLSEIEDAGLRLTTSFNSIGSTGETDTSTVFVYGLTDESLDGWSESIVIWDTAPANDTTSNGLDEEKVIALGSIDVPANEPPDQLSYMSQDLASFIQSDTNGPHNLWFSSKEDSAGTAADDSAPTLMVVLPEDPDADLPFDEIVGGTNFRDDYYASDWFGRFEFDADSETIRNGLGQIWVGMVRDENNMFLWSWELDQWLWTASSIYPYIYLLGNEEWAYVFSDRAFGTYVWSYENALWMDFTDTGWAYPLTSEEVMEGLHDTIAATDHPRILFSLDDLPVLREKVSEGWLAAGYDRMLQNAELMVARNNFDIAYSATLGRKMQDIISSMALAGYIEDDQRYIRYAIDFTLHQLRRFTLEELEFNNAGSPHLGLGDVTHALAVAYDWLYPEMTTSEREEMRTKLEELAVLQYDNLRTKYNGSSSFNDSSNHNAVGNGGLGLAAIALGDRPEWVEDAVRQIRRYMQFSSDDAGWNYEGTSYFGYGGWGAFPFASAVDRLNGPDLFEEFPKYDTVAVDYFLRQMPPYTSVSGIAAAMPIIMRNQDEVGLWLWLHVNGEEGNQTYGSAGSDISFWPYTLIWADPTLETTPPMEADLPLDKIYPSDRALFRDGWDPMDAVVTLTAGWTVHSGHRERKDNSFNFYALGERFVISPNDAQTRMEVLQSLVMVDEPRRNRNASEYPYGATFETVETTGDFAFVKSDATNSVVYYLEANGWASPDNRKVTEAVRHLLFARSPEGVNQPYVVIVDDLTARAESASFSWLLQTAPANVVDLGDTGDKFNVRGAVNGNRMWVNFLAPDNLTNEILSHEGRDEIKGRWSDDRINSRIQTVSTSTTGKSVRFIALLRAYGSATLAPSYSFTGTEMDGQITVTLADGTVDTITIDGDDISYSRESP
jgi:hypothetical protein